MAYEPTLYPQNVQKLQSLGLLSNSLDSNGFWTLQPLPFMIFPLVTIKDNKIPFALNTVEFLQYLGVDPQIAQQIFAELCMITNPTKLKLIELVKKYVAHQWTSGPYIGAGLNSVVGDLAMSHMGLNQHVTGLVNALWLRSRNDPSVMIRHINDPANGPFENFTLLDFVLETVDQLFTKLFILEKQVNENI